MHTGNTPVLQETVKRKYVVTTAVLVCEVNRDELPSPPKFSLFQCFSLQTAEQELMWHNFIEKYIEILKTFIYVEDGHINMFVII